MRDADLDRLLRAAAQADTLDATPAVPFGFETRVVALARTANGRSNDSAALTRLVRWVGASAIAVIMLATAAAYQQWSAAEAQSAPHENEYAIADSAIQTEFSR
jgi:hypothetical protein